MNNEVIIYQNKNNDVQVEVQFENDTVWLSQVQIALLFGTQRPAITKHLNNIFKSGELREKMVSSILEHTTSPKRRQGKRVNNKTYYATHQ